MTTGNEDGPGRKARAICFLAARLGFPESERFGIRPARQFFIFGTRPPMTPWQPSLAFPNSLGVTWPLVSPGFPIAVCWAHKSANTTMLKWFLFQIGLLERAQAEYPDQLHLFWHAHSSAQPNYADQCFRALAGPVRKLTVKVVRDPARRAVSGFLHFVRDPIDGFRETWRDFLAWKWSRGRSAAPTATFVDFLHFIIDTSAAGRLHDPHFQPQWSAAQDPFIIQHLPLEDLAAGLHELEQLCGVKASPLAALSESLHHSPPERGNRWPREAARLPLDADRLKSLGTPRYELLLDASTLALIGQAFAADYAAYAKLYPVPFGAAAARGTVESVPFTRRAAA
jgi:hypothetical protein